MLFTPKYSAENVLFIIELQALCDELIIVIFLYKVSKSTGYRLIFLLKKVFEFPMFFFFKCNFCFWLCTVYQHSIGL